MASITLYENSNYGGKAQTLTGSARSLVTTGFNDKASSFKVNGGTWFLFSDVDWAGSKWGPFTSDKSSPKNFGNDAVSSVALQVSSGDYSAMKGYVLDGLKASVKSHNFEWTSSMSSFVSSLMSDLYNKLDASRWGSANRRPFILQCWFDRNKQCLLDYADAVLNENFKFKVVSGNNAYVPGYNPDDIKKSQEQNNDENDNKKKLYMLLAGVSVVFVVSLVTLVVIIIKRRKRKRKAKK